MTKLAIICGLGLLTAACTGAVTPDAGSAAALDQFAHRADIRAAMLSANKTAAHNQCVSDNEKWLLEYKSPPPDGMIEALLARPLSIQLAMDKAKSGGKLVQLMVMDKEGCLIAADAKTHDLDQSDEPKFTGTVMRKGSDALYEGYEQRPRGNIDQLSQALFDEGGKPIGAITLRWCPVEGGCG